MNSSFATATVATMTSASAASCTEQPVPSIAAQARRYAVVGAGMAGMSCARALLQAGHDVVLFEREASPGGRLSAYDSPFGSFDLGVQYLTAQDSRFCQLLQSYPDLCRPWSASALHVLDAHGQVVAITPPAAQPHWVAQPHMQALAQVLAQPFQDSARIHCGLQVQRIERDRLHAQAWQLHCCSADSTEGSSVHAGFDAVLLAVPAPVAHALLHASNIHTPFNAALAGVLMQPCWTMQLAFPQAVQPGLTTLGPQWNAARSTHHRIAWLVRESSKPGRSQIERWTVQANPQWSLEHLHDNAERVQAKLHKAFVDVTGIHAAPAWSHVHRWSYAQTPDPLGSAYLWDSASGLGACGDWCLGSRVEMAFISGLELAQAVMS